MSGNDPTELAELEALAQALASEAGATLMAAFEQDHPVSYKRDGDERRAPTSPVSPVDQAVEAALRERLSRVAPAHGVIGEEDETLPGDERGVLWVIDPLDGTANFVNGFPLFSSSIGVLVDGVPVAGAIWCASSHALRPGVYHGRAGGELRFDGESFRRFGSNASVRRGLAGIPVRQAGAGRFVDHRVGGSAALDCALAAAGAYRFVHFAGTRIWDVAGGVALARAAGLAVRERSRAGWGPFERFRARKRRGSGPPSLRGWRGALLLGEPGALEGAEHELSGDE